MDRKDLLEKAKILDCYSFLSLVKDDDLSRKEREIIEYLVSHYGKWVSSEVMNVYFHFALTRVPTINKKYLENTLSNVARLKIKTGEEAIAAIEEFTKDVEKYNQKRVKNDIDNSPVSKSRIKAIEDAVLRYDDDKQLGSFIRGMFTQK
jgi:replication initiation and membrane attachment protein DnaB